MIGLKEDNSKILFGEHNQSGGSQVDIIGEAKKFFDNCVPVLSTPEYNYRKSPDEKFH